MRSIYECFQERLDKNVDMLVNEEKVEVLKSYMSGGKEKKDRGDIDVKSFKQYIKDAVKEAEAYAKGKNGKIKVDTSNGVLYIEYIFSEYGDDTRTDTLAIPHSLRNK